MKRLVFFGSTDFGIPTLEALQSSWEIVAVVTQPARPQGRRQEITPTAIERWAHEHAIRVITWTSLRDSDVATTLTELQPDCILVAAYGLIIPSSLLELFPHRWINIHASLLPRWRGASPIQAVIQAGDDVTGVTLMEMDAGVDTGPIIDQWSLAVSPTVTAPELFTNLAILAAANVPTALAVWTPSNTTPQPSEGVTMTHRITKDAGTISTWSDGQAIERSIRAFTPWPGVQAAWQHAALKILSATFTPGQPSETPGTIVHIPNGWAIACGNGWLQPNLVQVPGKRPITFDQFVGSYPAAAGAQL